MVLGFGALFVATLVLTHAIRIFGIPHTDYRGSFEEARSEALRDLSLVARIKKERFLAWLEERKGDARALAASSAAVRAVKEPEPDSQQTGPPVATGEGTTAVRTSGENRQAPVQSIQHIMTTRKGYKRIRVVAVETGRILASSDKTEQRAGVARGPIFSEAIGRNGEPWIDIERDAVDSRFYMVISVGIPSGQRDGQEARPSFLINSYVDTEEFIKPLLYTGGGLGSTGEIVLVDDQVRPLMQPNRRLPDGSVAEVLKDRLRAAPAEQAAQRKEGIIIGRDYAGVSVLAAYQTIPITKDKSWGLVVKRDEEEVLGPLWDGIFYSSLLGFIGILAAGGLAVLIANRISRPIEALCRTAEQVQAGMLDVRAPVLGTDEVGVLAKAFNSMIERVENWNRDLGEQVEQRTAQLVQSNRALELEIEERKRAEAELAAYQNQLEDLVKQRTSQLEIANHELQAFSYSVSHDLRAPLRHMDGFSRLLLKRYSDSLDSDAQEYLAHIRSAAQSMGQLIDDLLKLSRLTTVEMHEDRVDLSALAREIIGTLRSNQPDRDVAVVIEDGMASQGDAGLLRAALANLLGNAWKFTAHEPAARIEFGVAHHDGEDVYVIRDNGAGFDMTYAHKLFGPFQRLHGHDEFPGTGIGLAIVQRVLHRHGGRVWAEGEVGNGAAFFFTLPSDRTGS